jgi:hypothetical protein
VVEVSERKIRRERGRKKRAMLVVVDQLLEPAFDKVIEGNGRCDEACERKQCVRFDRGGGKEETHIRG